MSNVREIVKAHEAEEFRADLSLADKEKFDPETIRLRAEGYARDIWKKIGDITEFPLWMNRVLVGIYEKEKVGSIYMPDKTKDRDQFMCKGGLILKLGPGVDIDDHNVSFYGRKLRVGQWVAFMPADGWPIRVRDLQCRIIPDQHIYMGIPSPDLIY
jgi:hypothetical protein